MAPISATREAAARRTRPVSAEVIEAARVTTMMASEAVSPVVTPTPAAFAALVVKLENTKSEPARLASDTGSEKVTSTEVVLMASAEAMAGPALSRALAEKVGTWNEVDVSNIFALVVSETDGIAPESGAPSSVRFKVRLVTPAAA